MIYLLYGPDTVRSLKKLNEIIDEFRDQYGDLSLHKFDAEETELAAVKTILETGSLFAAKKLVIIKYFFASSWYRPHFYELLAKIKNNPDTTIVMWDRELAEKGVSEVRLHCGKIQEFGLSRADSQIPDVNIFRLGDTFFSSQREALRDLLHLLHRGHDDFNLFSYLANHARTLLIVKDYTDKGKPVLSSLGLHPYVIKKAAMLVRLLPIHHLHNALVRFFEEDYRIKTGALKPKDSLLRSLFS